MKLLLVEDNRDIAELIFDYFEEIDITLDYTASGTHGLTLALNEHYDCIILDLMLPGMDGLDVCKKLRDSGLNTPIIMLTARDTNSDVLIGLDKGADDYLIKPFALEILEARINALLRRSNAIGFNKEYVCGPLKVNLVSRQVYREKTRLKLNPTCYAILLMLVKHYPSPVSREEIERQIWGENSPDDDVLRKHMYQLRRIVDKPFRREIIITLPKIGYGIELNT